MRREAILWVSWVAPEGEMALARKAMVAAVAAAPADRVVKQVEGAATVVTPAVVVAREVG